MVCITYQYMVCMHAIYVLILYIHPIIMHDYAMLLTYVHATYLNNLQMITLLEMVCNTYHDMYAYYTCTDIMHTFYYNVCIDNYAISLTLDAVYLKNFKVTAVLEK